MSDSPLDNGQATTSAEPIEYLAPGVPPLVEPLQESGRAEIVVGAAFIGGLILGKLVKRRGK